MSQPCCFAHHSVTAESMPPERRMIARSMERTVFMRRDARRAAPGRRLPTHKYLSQTRPTGGGEYLMRLAVPLAECLADEGRDRRDHAPHDIPVFVRH